MAKAKRIFELAKALGVESKAILDKCRAEGFSVTSHMATVSVRLEATIREWFRDDGSKKNRTRAPMQLKDLAEELGMDLNKLIEACSVHGIEPLMSFSDIDSATEKKIRAIIGPSDGVADQADDHEAIRSVQKSSASSRSAKTSSAAISGADSAGNTTGGARSICLLGMRLSGKTVFWASLIEQSLVLGFDRIAAMLNGWRPDPPVGRVRNAARDICKKLLAGQTIDATDASVYEEFSLTFKKRRDLFFRSTYVFQSHDLAGENISRWIEEDQVPKQILDRLSEDAANAQGLVILVDPTQGDDALNWQDHLWRMLLDRLRVESGREHFDRPVVLVFTKADEPSVAEQLGMPSLSERTAAQHDPVKYAELTDHQDLVVRRFVEKRLPKTWQAINRSEPQRHVRNATVMAMSSTGVPVREGQRVDALHPWRITDPFIWILKALEPIAYRQPYSSIIRAGLLLCVAGILAAVLGWGHWERYNTLATVEARARSALNEKQFGIAYQELSEAKGISSWLYDESRISCLRTDIEREESLFLLNERTKREEFLAAFEYLAKRVPDHAQSEARSVLLDTLNEWRRENSPPLLFSDTWVSHNYSDAVANAEIARALAPEEEWVLVWNEAAQARASMVRTAPLLDDDTMVSTAIAELCVAQRHAVAVSSDTALSRQILRELNFLVNRLQRRLIAQMKACYFGKSFAPKDLLNLARCVASVRSQSWCSAPRELLFWEVRLSMYALLASGRPTEAVKAYESDLPDIRQLEDSMRKRLAAMATVCSRATEMAYIPPAQYTLGDDVRASSSGPRTVKLPVFYIDKKEVTKSAFHEFVKTTKYKPRSNDEWFLMDWRQSPLLPYEKERSDSVRYVNAVDAEAFAKHHGCDLPTEDEWEIAAGWNRKTGRVLQYPYGDTFSAEVTTIESWGNVLGRSPSGCLDMAGGLWEWVKTKGEDEYVLKGGYGKSPLGPDRLRETTRVCYRRSMKIGTERRLQYGFRCVLRPSDLIPRKE